MLSLLIARQRFKDTGSRLVLRLAAAYALGQKSRFDGNRAFWPARVTLKLAASLMGVYFESRRSVFFAIKKW